MITRAQTLQGEPHKLLKSCIQNNQCKQFMFNAEKPVVLYMYIWGFKQTCQLAISWIVVHTRTPNSEMIYLTKILHFVSPLTNI